MKLPRILFALIICLIGLKGLTSCSDEPTLLELEQKKKEVELKKADEDEKAIKNIYDYSMLPKGFEIKQRLGDGWIIFEFKGNKYLYRRFGNMEFATEVMAPFHD